MLKEYPDVYKSTLAFEDKTIEMIKEFSDRLIKLVCDWLRVG